MSFGFNKKERLTGREEINALFAQGESIYCYPFRILFIKSSEKQVYHRIMISAPKRNFKKAVDRNKIKRLIKESYRKNKDLLENTPSKYSIGLIYTPKSILSFSEINKHMVNTLKKLRDHIN